MSRTSPYLRFAATVSCRPDNYPPIGECRATFRRCRNGRVLTSFRISPGPSHRIHLKAYLLPERDMTEDQYRELFETMGKESRELRHVLCYGETAQAGVLQSQ